MAANTETNKTMLTYIFAKMEIKFNNVFKTDDILSNKSNPAVIAKYVKKDDGTYTIPEFGLV